MSHGPRHVKQRNRGTSSSGIKILRVFLLATTPGVGPIFAASFVSVIDAAHRFRLNFMLRVPPWPVTTLDSKTLGPAVAKEIAVADRHELAAGKLAALDARVLIARRPQSFHPTYARGSGRYAQ
jgi:hypothetical protein